MRRLDRHPGLPVGRTATTRRLLRTVLHGQRHALVIGPPHAVRQALPAARLDVVGTNPDDPSITVVSEALGRSSLPRRWDCVIVTEIDPSQERLVAATEACLPDGRVVILRSRSRVRAAAPGIEVQRCDRAGEIQVVVGRVKS
jgi:hypothetical protein